MVSPRTLQDGRRALPHGPEIAIVVPFVAVPVLPDAQNEPPQNERLSTLFMHDAAIILPNSAEDSKVRAMRTP